MVGDYEYHKLKAQLAILKGCCERIFDIFRAKCHTTNQVTN